VNLKLILITFTILCSLIAVTNAAQNDLNFLVGDWVGSGSGEPGQGAGSFSFAPDLQQHIVIRRAHSEYPASGNKPPIVHDDLLIVYSDQAKAIYFDNEGHVIHYDITTDLQKKSATFLSTDPSPMPLFRLTYVQASDNKLTITFEISPTGKTQDLKTYLTGAATRKVSS
jgi:hypothetical protein